MTRKEELYARISELKEAKDFMRVLKKWDVLSDKLELQKDAPIIIPDLLWVAKSGVGKTNLLNLLSEYLYECGTLMEFSGEIKYFEFMLDYYPPEQGFPEIHRLMDEASNCAGFRNVFRGIVSVDLDEWLGHCEERHFISFLECLAGNKRDWLIVFNVNGDNKEEIRQLEYILSMFFRLERASISFPDTTELAAFVSERLGNYGITLAPDAEALIFSTIDKLRQNKYFDGYKTLIILCQDIVYEIYSGNTADNTCVGAEALARFAADGEYVMRATRTAESKRKIGLLGGKKDE